MPRASISSRVPNARNELPVEDTPSILGVKHERHGEAGQASFRDHLDNLPVGINDPLLDVAVTRGGDALVALAALTGTLALAYLVGGWQSIGQGRAASVLRSGSRAGSDARAVFVRKALTAVHTSLAGAVLIGAAVFAGAALLVGITGISG